MDPPSGPIVDSFPVMRAMPAMMAMPMMPMMYGQAMVPQTRAVTFEEPRARSTRNPERTCEDSHDRLDDLDARVEALNLRMKTVQRAVELQTQLLEELRAQGAFGKKTE